MDGSGGDGELAGAEEEVGVCRCAAQSVTLAFEYR